VPATFSFLPDTLDLVFVQGDELNILLDFDLDLTDYTFQTRVYKVLAVANGNVTSTEPAVTFTQTPVDLSLGKINLSLTETQTSSLSLTSNYRWLFRWIAPGIVTRTVLSGAVSVKSP
jgi:hypothetical protein